MSGNEIKCNDNNGSVVKENLTTYANKNQQASYENSENYLQKTCDTCGVRYGAIFKINPVSKIYV